MPKKSTNLQLSKNDNGFRGTIFLFAIDKPKSACYTNFATKNAAVTGKND